MTEPVACQFNVLNLSHSPLTRRYSLERLKVRLGTVAATKD
jgi:hypothetical protein